MAIFDYASDRAKERGQTITLIIKKHNKYGSAGPGDHVVVDLAESRNPAVCGSPLSACMTAEEAKAEEAKAEAKAEAAAEAARAKGKVKAMVDEGLMRLRHAALLKSGKDETEE